MHFIASFVSDVRADQTNSSILYVRRSIQFKHFFFIFRFCFTFTFLYVRSMQQRTTKSCFAHLSNYTHGALLAITSFPLGTHHRAYNGNDSFFFNAIALSRFFFSAAAAPHAHPVLVIEKGKNEQKKLLHHFIRSAVYKEISAHCNSIVSSSLILKVKSSRKQNQHQHA